MPINNQQADKVQYLGMLQDVINRMGYKSFLIKGWAFVLITVFAALLIREGNPLSIAVVLAVLMAFLWALDAYFLSLERKYRELYERVRKNEQEINFDMSVPKHTQPYSDMWHAFFSKTLVPFYLLLLMVSASVYLIVGGG